MHSYECWFLMCTLYLSIYLFIYLYVSICTYIYICSMSVCMYVYEARQVAQRFMHMELYKRRLPHRSQRSTDPHAWYFEILFKTLLPPRVIKVVNFFTIWFLPESWHHASLTFSVFPSSFSISTGTLSGFNSFYTHLIFCGSSFRYW